MPLLRAAPSQYIANRLPHDLQAFPRLLARRSGVAEDEAAAIDRAAVPDTFRGDGSIIDARISEKAGDMHAGNRRLKLEQSIEHLRFFEKGEPAFVVYRPCGAQMLSEVAFCDERSKHSLRQQSSVA